MPYTAIKNRRTGQIIHEGPFTTVRACAEDAVRRQIALDYADLSYADLSRAALDGACLRHAVLTGANLTGANLSEAALDYIDARNATFYDCCLCYSDLSHGDFRHALWGGTDVAGAAFRHVRVSDPSVFSLSFTEMENPVSGIYEDLDGRCCPFTHPPLAIQGLRYRLTMLDQDAIVGNHGVALDAIASMAATGMPLRAGVDHNLSVFLFHNRAKLKMLIELFRGDGLYTIQSAA